MQTVGLAQQIIEERGIPTASITLLADVTRKIRPPRSLAVPYPLGFPLGEAGNPELQRSVLRALLATLERTDVPVLETFQPPG
jgi:D-proline reductase (dithiol) PrdB